MSDDEAASEAMKRSVSESLKSPEVRAVLEKNRKSLIAKVKAEAFRAGQENMRRRAVEAIKDYRFWIGDTAKMEISEAIAALEVKDE